MTAIIVGAWCFFWLAWYRRYLEVKITIDVYWPSVFFAFMGSLALLALALAGLHLFIKWRRIGYPEPGQKTIDFLNLYFCQRKLSLVQMLYALPKNWIPSLIFIAFLGSQLWPLWITGGLEILIKCLGPTAAPNLWSGVLSAMRGFLIGLAMFWCFWLLVDDYRHPRVGLSEPHG